MTTGAAVFGSVLRDLGLLPAAIVNSLDQADVAADGLLAGGVPLIEVTLRTDTALAAIEHLASRGDLLIGAGTVLTAHMVDQVVDAGATFVVSPGWSQTVVERAQARGVGVLPGAVTATEVQAASVAGIDLVKLFPAEPAGGVPLIDSLSGPFPTMSFVPTGGVTPSNLGDYITHPSVAAVGGSWLTPAGALIAGDRARIGELAASARTLVKHARSLVADETHA